MVCFSLAWHNPLLWSHYGDSHRGIALGFDLDATKCKKVKYVEERPELRTIDLAVAHELLFTKYVDWKYEEEIRTFTNLNDIDSETKLYFADFGGGLRLAGGHPWPTQRRDRAYLASGTRRHESGPRVDKSEAGVQK